MDGFGPGVSIIGGGLVECWAKGSRKVISGTRGEPRRTRICRCFEDGGVVVDETGDDAEKADEFEGAVLLLTLLLLLLLLLRLLVCLVVVGPLVGEGTLLSPRELLSISVCRPNLPPVLIFCGLAPLPLPLLDWEDFPWFAVVVDSEAMPLEAEKDGGVGKV